MWVDILSRINLTVIWNKEEFKLLRKKYDYNKRLFKFMVLEIVNLKISG